MEDKDFIDFKFNEHWASEFDLIAVSNGDRYTSSFYGNVNSNTSTIVGKIGIQKWNTQINEKTFSINIAYDNINLETLRKIKEWLNPFIIGKLVFKEEPYKYYWVSLNEDPQISFLPFKIEKNTIDGRTYKRGVYKGELTLSFICVDNYGYSSWQSFDEDFDYLVKELFGEDHISFSDGSDNNLFFSKIEGNLYQEIIEEEKGITIENSMLTITDMDLNKESYLEVKGYSDQEIIEEEKGQTIQDVTSIYVDDVDDTKEHSIEILGNSIQETREGYNLLNISEISSTWTQWKIENFKYKKYQLKPNTSYTISQLKDRISGETGTLLGYIYATSGEEVAETMAVSANGCLVGQPRTIVSDNNGYIIVYVNVTEELTNDLGLMLVEGTEEKEYEAYGASPSFDYPSEIKCLQEEAEIKHTNKNLVDLITTTLNVSGWKVGESYNEGDEKVLKLPYNENSVWDAFFFYLDERYVGKNVSFSFDIKVKNLKYLGSDRFVLENTAQYAQSVIKNLYSSSLKENTYVHIEAENYKLKNKTIGIMAGVNYKSEEPDSDYMYVYIKNFQIELGEQITEYTEHQEESCPLDIQQDMVSPEDDYFDLERKKEVHGWGKVVLTGGETITKYSDFHYFINKSDAYKASTSQSDNISSTHFKADTANNFWNSAYDKDNYIVLTPFQQIGFVIKSYATIDEFKSALAEKYTNGKPVIVYYKLETPIELDLTDTQIQQLEKLNKLRFYEGVNNIMTLEDIASLKLHYNYVTPAPSIGRSSKISILGDNINLFDKDNLIKVFGSSSYEVTENGIKIINNNNQQYMACIFKFFDVSNYKGENYTLKGKWTCSANNTGRMILGLCNEDGTERQSLKILDESESYVTLTIPENLENTNYLAIWFYSNVTGTAQTNDYVLYENIKLEKGKMATSYSQYNKGSIEIKKVNKNLFDKNNYVKIIQGQFLSTGGFNNDNRHKTILIECEGNLELSVYMKNANNYMNATLACFSEIPNPGTTKPIKISNSPNALNIITPAETKYLAIYLGATFHEGWTSIEDVLDSLMLTIGNIKLTEEDYVEHQEENYLLEIQQPMLTDDYFDLYRKKEVHNWEKIIFNGTENITKVLDNIYNYTLTKKAKAIINDKTSHKSNKYISAICTGSNDAFVIAAASDYAINLNSGDGMKLRIKDVRNLSADDFKNSLIPVGLILLFFIFSTI